MYTLMWIIKFCSLNTLSQQRNVAFPLMRKILTFSQMLTSATTSQILTSLLSHLIINVFIVKLSYSALGFTI